VLDEHAAAYSPSQISSVSLRRSSSAKPAVRANASDGVTPPLPPKPLTPKQPGDRIGVIVRPVGEQRTEIDLGHRSVPLAVHEARVEHADHPPAAQVEQLPHDLAAEPLGRLEPDEQHLQRAVARLFGVHGLETTPRRPATRVRPADPGTASSRDSVCETHTSERQTLPLSSMAHGRIRH
jgi:hypothetical protein